MGTGRGITLSLVLALSGLVGAAPAQTEAPALGSSAFCLFELPAESDKRTWLNLGIVQYIDLRPTELRIFYGGGNFGGGHELRLPLGSREEGLAYMRRMQTVAANCRGPSRGN